MAQFTKSLCELVIKDEGCTSLTAWEKLQLANLALKELERREHVGPLPSSNDSSNDASDKP